MSKETIVGHRPTIIVSALSTFQQNIMKKTFSILLLISSLTTVAQKDLLRGKYTREQLQAVLIPLANWVPFPKPGDAAWSKANQATLQSYVQQAEQYLNYSWPSIPATKSLLIERTGDRAQYQAISNERRDALVTLLLGEIHENKGRFLDQIINGVWSICEESFWGASAHLPKTKEISGLVDVSQPFVELFSAETATYLAWIDYFLGDKLDAVSPQIRKRIYYEVNNRIFTPAMTKKHGWMTTNANGRRPNNWNPWICSNWLNAALLLEKDETRRTDMVYKILEVVDEFLNPYPQDGGCDEGPGYWNAAAASLYDNISLLNLATNNSFAYAFRDEKIRNMGRFIYRAQIGEKYFLNFADADPQPAMAANMIYRYGKDIQDDDMMRFGAYYRRPDGGRPSRGHFFRNFFSLFIHDEFQNTPQKLPLPANVWLPDTEVMIARDIEGSVKGFFVAAKGGHNDESHNHNDIGNYVVYYDGLPVIIDVGRGTYTAKTFSSRRYEIWYNRSDYHNVPTVNDITQAPGAMFKADNVKYQYGKGFAQLSLDIAKSYPDSAGIKNLERTIRLNRGRNVEITDIVSLNNSGKLTQHIMTCYPAEVTKPGELVIHYAPKDALAKDFVIRYDPKQFDPIVEKIPLTTMEDQGIITKWGDSIYRINFNAIAPSNSYKMKFVVALK